MAGSFQPGGRPGRIPTDHQATLFEDLDISLFDLHRANRVSEQRVITGRTFRNCVIEGPAVMLVLSGVSFDGVNFGFAAGDIRNLLLRPLGQDQVTGTIPVQNCAFINCEFFAVGFTGPEEFLQQIQALDITT
jgi:hypothetical protein